MGSSTRGGSFFLLLFFFGNLFRAAGQAIVPEDSLPTNAQYFQQGISEVTLSLLQEVQHIPPDTVEVHILPCPNGWFVEQEALKTLQQRSVAAKLFSPVASTGIVMQMFPTAMNVTYSRPFRNSFMGSRVVERNAWVSIASTISKHTNGEVLFTGDKSWSKKDTINWDAVSRVENEYLDFTIGKKEDTQWYDSYIEPVVVIGTAAVVIFLFFTIRS